MQSGVTSSFGDTAHDVMTGDPVTNTTFDPILKFRELGLFARLAPPPLGTALVLQADEGEPLVVRAMEAVPNLWRGRYRRSFLVDTSAHHLRMEEQLPSADSAFTFQCVLTAKCAVRDPTLVVSLGIRDIAAALRVPIVRIMRAVTRGFDVSELGEAEAALDNALGVFRGDAAVRLDGHLIELSGGGRDTYSSAEYQQASREIRIESLRRQHMLEMLTGGRDLLIAQWLAKHDGDPAALLEMESTSKALQTEHLLRMLEILSSSVERGENIEAFAPDTGRSHLIDHLLRTVTDLTSSDKSSLAPRLSPPQVPSSHGDAESNDYEDWTAVGEWPVVVYLADNSDTASEQVLRSIQALCTDLGYEMEPESAPVIGSFWQRFRAKATSPEAQRALHDRIVKLERSVEVRMLAVPESLANMQNAQGLAAIIKALEKESSAVIQIGPLLILKASNADGSSAVSCKTLTPSELRLLERRPELLNDPTSILLMLDPSRQGEPGTTT